MLVYVSVRWMIPVSLTFLVMQALSGFMVFLPTNALILERVHERDLSNMQYVAPLLSTFLTGDPINHNICDWSANVTRSPAFGFLHRSVASTIVELTQPLAIAVNTDLVAGPLSAWQQPQLAISGWRLG